ncbi:ADP-ribosylglycohydrolase family protein [Arthrobacter sp. KK5.5]|uniref:ADP-ribosylglycohydrolase family protein n=1 Tax=Arthrobacter sp. KK5.5 TaxID=3373084 RepID=UPI003EE5D973
MTSTHETSLTAEQFADRVVAVLAATAIAPGLGHAADAAPQGTLDGGSSLQLYLMDGLLEALEWANDGFGSDEAACMWLAGLRWHRLATGSFPDGAPEPRPRWLDEALAPLAPGGIAPADPLDLSGLDHDAMGTVGRPHDASADGPGVLARAAVSALLPRVTPATTAKFATDAAALTHGSRAATSAAAAAAMLVHRALSGAGVPGEKDAGTGEKGHAWDALRAAVAAVAAAGRAYADPADALADAAGTLCARGRTPEAAFAGALLAAAHGTAALPADWESLTPSADAIREMARRWIRLTFGEG